MLFTLPESKPKETVSTIAVAIGLSDPAVDQWHTGILHKKDGGDVAFLHLAGHLELTEGEIPEGYAWLIPQVPMEMGYQIKAMCRLVAKTYSHGEIPYGFQFKATRFSLGEGKIEMGEGEVGLTCATFVLSIFGSVGVDLIKIETWPTRAEDQAWRDTMISTYESLRDRYTAKAEYYRNMATASQSLGQDPSEIIVIVQKYELKAAGIDAFVEKWKTEPVCVRIRPCEVAGACNLENPAEFPQVNIEAEGIAAKLRRH